MLYRKNQTSRHSVVYPVAADTQASSRYLNARIGPTLFTLDLFSRSWSDAQDTAHNRDCEGDFAYLSYA